MRCIGPVCGAHATGVTFPELDWTARARLGTTRGCGALSEAGTFIMTDRLTTAKAVHSTYTMNRLRGNGSPFDTDHANRAQAERGPNERISDAVLCAYPFVFPKDAFGTELLIRTKTAVYDMIETDARYIMTIPMNVHITAAEADDN